MVQAVPGADHGAMVNHKHLMGLALSCAVAFTASSCGGTAEKATGVTGTGQEKFLNVEQYLMRDNEEPGFRGDGDVWVDTAEALIKGERMTQAEARLLRQAGLITVTARRIAGPGAGGITNVHLFASAQGAQRWMKHEARGNWIHLDHPGIKLRHFTVAGVPGASGWTAPIPNEAPVGNVFWVQGRCLLTLGNQGAGGLTGRLAAGVRAIYRRTGAGLCP